MSMHAKVIVTVRDISVAMCVRNFSQPFLEITDAQYFPPHFQSITAHVRIFGSSSYVRAPVFEEHTCLQMLLFTYMMYTRCLFASPFAGTTHVSVKA